jgi:hypothetical protein
MRRYAMGLALTLGVGLTVYPVVKVSEVNVVSTIGAVGLILLAVALTSLRARSLLVGAVILIALHYVLSLHVAHAALDVYAILVGAGLFLLFELADLSISMTGVAPMTRPAMTYRVATTLTTAAAGALLAAVALAARSVMSGGVPSVALGATCALGVIAVSVSLAQRPREARGRSAGDATG